MIDTTQLDPRARLPISLGRGRLASLGLSALLSTLLLSGCGKPEPVSLELVERFIEQPCQRLFQLKDLVLSDEAFDWPLRGLGIGADWGAPQPPYQLELGGALADVSMDGNRLMIERSVSFEAGAIDRIDVVLVSRKPGSAFTGNVILLWAGPGETIDGSRGLEVPAGEDLGGGLRRYQITIGRQSDWQGSIARLRIVCAIAERGQIGLRRVTGYREAVAAERLAALRVEGLKASLGEQARDALLALPGLPVERQLELPPRAQLRLAVGAQLGIDQPVELEVVVEPAGGQPGRPWVSTLLPPGDGAAEGLEAGRWHPVTIDLGAFAGQWVTLRLAASSQAALDLRHGFIFWGHPEILAERR